MSAEDPPYKYSGTATFKITEAQLWEAFQEVNADWPSNPSENEKKRQFRELFMARVRELTD